MAYSEEQKKDIFDKICSKIAFEGKSLRAIIREGNFPEISTIYEWLKNDDDKSKQYARACDLRADYIFEDILDIADDSSNDEFEIQISETVTTTKTNYENIQRSRLKVDARKWMLSKMNPKKYSDKLDVTTNGNDITKKERPKIVFKNIEKDNE